MAQKSASERHDVKKTNRQPVRAVPKHDALHPRAKKTPAGQPREIPGLQDKEEENGGPDGKQMNVHAKSDKH